MSLYKQKYVYLYILSMSLTEIFFMRFSFSHITKDQSSIIKAIAIIMIVLHNFLHWSNNIGENELDLDPNKINLFISSIYNSPLMIFNSIFSYFGHYGVQLFIFISGYGLAKQYSQKSKISYYNYIVPKLVKIYSLLIFGIIVYFLLFFYSMDMHYAISFVSSTLLMFNNLYSSRIFRFVGPWWYFSLAIQLYLIFPFLYKFINRKENTSRYFVISLIVTYIVIYLLFPTTQKYNIPIFGNFIGHLPEFLLGIFLAISPKTILSWKVILPTLFIFVLSNKIIYLFPFSFLCITILLLVICYYIYTYSKIFILKLLLFIGSISMMIFVINGPLRYISIPILEGTSFLDGPLKFIKTPYFEGIPPLVILGFSFLHLAFVIIVSFILQKIYNKFVTPNTIKVTNLLINKKNK